VFIDVEEIVIGERQLTKDNMLVNFPVKMSFVSPGKILNQFLETPGVWEAITAYMANMPEDFVVNITQADKGTYVASKLRSCPKLVYVFQERSRIML